MVRIGDEERGFGGGEPRAVVYCLVPADLAAKLHEPLREHFRDQPGVEVVVERRRDERRSGAERRREEGAAPAGEERRVLRSARGRRVGERRAALVPVPAGEAPELPRRARRHADRIGFAARVEPPSQAAEDRDTARVVARFQAGDRDAFGVIYTRYFDRVYSYLRVALRDSHEAEDLAQQVFMRAFEALPAYERRRQPLRAWLFTIVRNHAVSHLRRHSRVELVDPSELAATAQESGEVETSLPVFEWITDRDLTVFVERLPVSQRQVLILRYLLDLGSPEIAAILDMSPDQVRGLQRRALAFLRERLRAIGREPKSSERPGIRRWRKQAPVLRERRFALK